MAKSFKDDSKIKLRGKISLLCFLHMLKKIPKLCLLLLLFQGRIVSSSSTWEQSKPSHQNSPLRYLKSRCAGHWAISKSGPPPTAGLFMAIWFITINVFEVLLIKLSTQADGNSSVMWNNALQCREPAKCSAEEHAGFTQIFVANCMPCFLQQDPENHESGGWGEGSFLQTCT